jgi:hypothetical protein
MKVLNTSSILLGALPLVAGSATAQIITPLIVEGDALPNGLVTATYNSDINNSGDWIVELDTDNPDSKMDNAVVFNGTMIHQEGTSLGFPASHASAWVYDSFLDTMDINDNGDRLLLFNVEDQTLVLSDRKLILWTNGSTGVTYPLMEDDVTPNTANGEPAGALWDSIQEVWQNNNNQLLVAGRSNTDGDDMVVMLTHDGAGNILSQTQFVVDGVIHSAAFPAATGLHLDTVQTLGVSQPNIAFNNAAQKMFYVDDQSFGSGGTPDYTMQDSHFYIDTTEIAWEADDAPTAGTFPYNHLSSAEVDINDTGHWVAAWDDDNPTTTDDGFILVDGNIYVQEGQAAPIGGGFVLEGVSFNNGGVQISEIGDITWTAEWNDPDTSKDKGLYRNFQLLVQEGVTMIGGLAVIDIRTSQSGEEMSVSDSGRFITKELHLDGSLEGIYLIDINPVVSYCDSVSSVSGCPCGNIGATGEGCQNSTGAGALLSATGSSSITADDLVLMGTQLPPSKPGLFFTGPNQVGAGSGSLFGDGLLCVGGSIQRLQTVFSDLSGNAQTTLSIATGGGVTVGSVANYQLWFRDPAGPCGAAFNTTNALSLIWH